MSLIKSITTRLSTVSNKSLREVTEKCFRRTSWRSNWWKQASENTKLWHRIATCLVFNQYLFGTLSGWKMKAEPERHLPGIFCACKYIFILVTTFHFSCRRRTCLFLWGTRNVSKDCTSLIPIQKPHFCGLIRLHKQIFFEYLFHNTMPHVVWIRHLGIVLVSLVGEMSCLVLLHVLSGKWQPYMI